MQMSLRGDVPKIGNSDHECDKKVKKVLTRYEEQKNRKRKEREGKSVPSWDLDESLLETEVSLHSEASESEYFDLEEEIEKQKKEKHKEKEEKKKKETKKIGGNESLYWR